MLKKILKILLCVILMNVFCPECVKAQDGLNYSKNNIYDIVENVKIDSDGNIEIYLSLNEEEIENLSVEERMLISSTIGDDILNKKYNNTKGRPEYYNEYGAVQRKKAVGYPGNQPSGGTIFPTGGGFYWSDSGGPEISISVGLNGLGGKFDIISFSLNLGVVGTSGSFAVAPTTTDYYKLCVEKEYDCTPYITYCKKSTGEITIIGKNVIKVYVRASTYAVKV